MITQTLEKQEQDTQQEKKVLRGPTKAVCREYRRNTKEEDVFSELVEVKLVVRILVDESYPDMEPGFYEYEVRFMPTSTRSMEAWLQHRREDLTPSDKSWKRAPDNGNPLYNPEREGFTFHDQYDVWVRWPLPLVSK